MVGSDWGTLESAFRLQPILQLIGYYLKNDHRAKPKKTIGTEE